MCCVARWWTGCVAGSLGLVPDALRSLPGHPRGGSVQPRSFPPACLQEMQDKGVALAEAERWRQERHQIGCWEEKGVTVVGRRFLDSPLNNKMWPGPVRNARSTFIAAPVGQERHQPPSLYPKLLLGLRR